MKTKNFARAGIAALFSTLFVLFGSASAAPVTLNLTIQFLDPSGSLEGSGQFDYDPVTGEFSNINFSAPAGDVSGAAFVTTNDTFAGDTRISFLSTSVVDLTGARWFDLGLDGSLSDLANGLVASLTGVFGGDLLCNNSDCSDTSILRNLAPPASVTLAVSDVPLPAALPLFIAGLGGLAFARRRKA
ncbi:VPLPA-CTERM sorting domain-containing protein [Hyphococcus sp.]|uniref:VPLPA-CTERM sorting domain-containing protein n=1 Tax=Hyphococcus sp. TaxID=2038636 RepID=UPI002083F257|nr:MAG: hypothetical protein DHS20C04_14560 [Marinicaulis sp.]